MSIHVNQVTKLYGQQKALDQVSFAIEKGQIVGFLGPNGAGKSTMMKIITCFIPQSSGEVEVCGFNVKEQALEIKKRIGYLPEHNPRYDDMYVKENLNFLAGLHNIQGSKTKRIEELINMVGLGREQHKKIGALSKGYKQRVGLAQALIHDPEVLILDEATTGLDVNQIIEIRDLIKDLGREKTVMMSTHIMQEVEAVCERVIIINRGKIVADEGVNYLTSMSGGSQIIEVEFSKSVALEELQKIEGVEKAEAKSANSYNLFASGSLDIRTKIFQWAVAQELEVLTIQKKEQKLEDVFKALTKD